MKNAIAVPLIALLTGCLYVTPTPLADCAVPGPNDSGPFTCVNRERTRCETMPDTAENRESCETTGWVAGACGLWTVGCCATSVPTWDGQEWCAAEHAVCWTSEPTPGSREADCAAEGGAWKAAM